MSDGLDRLLDESRPADLMDLPGVADRARDVAASTAIGNIGGFRPRRARFWGLIAFGTVSIAVSAAAIPPLVAWAPWEPDVVMSREFPVTDGGAATSCDVIVRVGQDEGEKSDDAARHLEEARAFLQEGDWSDLGVDLDDIDTYLDKLPPEQRALQEQTRGRLSPPAFLALLASDEIHAAFADAGYLTDDVWIESMGRCEEVAE